MPRRTFLLFGLLIAALLIFPALAHAAPLYQEIQTKNFREIWAFSRSFVNYVLIGVLLVAAFANVLRLNIDSYGIKKLLPGLITGFILANFSLFILSMILTVSATLTRTAITIAPEALGTAIGDIDTDSGLGAALMAAYATKLKALILSALGGGVVGGAAVAGGASNPIGIGIGLLIAALVIFLPVAILWVLWLLFWVRYYMVFMLGALAPVAFILMAIPFTQKVFQSWWKQFATWVFMKPIAFLIISLSFIVMNLQIGSGWLNTIVPFALGMAGLIMAIIVPFKAGGAVNAALAGWAKGGLGAGRTTLAGGLMKYTDDKGWRGKASRGLIGTMYAPAKIKEGIEANRKLTDARGEKIAYGSVLNKKYKASKMDDALIGEKKKEYDEETVEEMAKLYANGSIKQREHIIAMLRRVYEKGDNPKFWKLINDQLRNGDSATQGRLRKQLNLKDGQMIEEGPGKANALLHLLGAEQDSTDLSQNGKVTGDDAIRQMQILQSSAKRNGNAEESEGMTMSVDATTGQTTYVRLSTENSIKNALNYIGRHPQSDARDASYFEWILDEKLSDFQLAALKAGRYDTMMESYGNEFNSGTKAALVGAIQKPEFQTALQRATGAEKVRLEAFQNMILNSGEDAKQKKLGERIRNAGTVPPPPPPPPPSPLGPNAGGRRGGPNAGGGGVNPNP